MLTLPAAALLDRVIVQEELALGQRVRNFTVESQAAKGGPWQPFLSRQSKALSRLGHS